MKCKMCGEELIVDDSVVLTSYPPKFKAYCQNCGDGYVYCRDYMQSKYDDCVESIKKGFELCRKHQKGN